MNILRFLTNSKEILHEVNGDDLLVLMDDTTRTQLQKTLLGMYVDIYNICRKYDITPFLVGGSALGAVRHKGFIPWDDDFDIAMTRKDYECFKKVFKYELSDKYILNAPNYSKNPKERFPKILKKGTVLREIIDSPDQDLHRVFIDLFVLENVPNSKIIFYLKGWYCNCLEFIAGKVFFYENRDDLVKQLYLRTGSFNYNIRLLIGFLFSWKKSSKWFDLVDKSVQHRVETKRVNAPTGRKHYFGEIFFYDQLFPATMVFFDGYEFPVFKNYDLYLSNLYHNYMTIPAIGKRERHAYRDLQLNDC